MTVNSFAKEIGVDPANLSKKIKGKQNFTRRDRIALQLRSYINYKWLETGEGPMLKASPASVAARQPVSGVPFYNADFAGGFVEFEDKAEYPTAYINMPGMQNATCWCRVSGNSMNPLISNGDLICLKVVEDWDKFLDYGDVYAIDMVTGQRTVKRIGRGSTEENIKLIPDNKEADTQEIEKASIRRMFKVCGVMKVL